MSSGWKLVQILSCCTRLKCIKSKYSRKYNVCVYMYVSVWGNLSGDWGFETQTKSITSPEWRCYGRVSIMFFTRTDSQAWMSFWTWPLQTEYNQTLGLITLCNRFFFFGMRHPLLNTCCLPCSVFFFCCSKRGLWCGASVSESVADIACTLLAYLVLKTR